MADNKTLSQINNLNRGFSRQSAPNLNYTSEEELQTSLNETQARITKLLNDSFKSSLKVQLEEAKKNESVIAKYRENLIKQGNKKGFDDQKKLDALLRSEKRKSDKLDREQYLKEQKDILKEIFKDKENLSKEEIKKYKKQMKEVNKELMEEYNKNSLNNAMGKAMTRIATNALSTFTSGLDTYIDNYQSIKSGVNVRLQGSSYEKGSTWSNIRNMGLSSSFDNLENSILDKLGANPYIKTTDVVSSLQELANSGVAYNLEQRAFLSGIAKNISATFDSANGTLLRLIRIQQSDSTAVRLGLEAYLTRFLNANFADSSYLGSSYHNVESSLLDSLSLLGYNESVSSEYQIQKWLGAMESVGVSTNTISTLATALNALGSGDVSNLGSGASNLLLMASSASGVSYADMLKNGLDESNLNKLLQSAVEYLQSIAKSNNNIIKSQYASLFGISVSDLASIGNLSASDIAKLSKSTMSTSSATGELNYQMTQIAKRLGISNMTSNLLTNTQYQLGAQIAQNPALLATWKLASLFSDSGYEINIPTVMTLGTGIDLNTSVDKLMKLGIVGASSLGAIGSIISGVTNTFNPVGMLSKFGVDQRNVLVHGSLTDTIGQQVSTKMAITTTSGSDIADQARLSAENEARQTISDSSQEDMDMQKEFYKYMINEFKNGMSALFSDLSSAYMNGAINVRITEV